MIPRLAFLTVAMIGVAGLAYAQGTTTTPAPTPAQTQQKTVQQAKSTATPAPTKKNNTHRMQAQTCGMHQTVAMTDEYGFKYDSRGDRLNAAGCVIPPPHSRPGAKVIQN